MVDFSLRKIAKGARNPQRAVEALKPDLLRFNGRLYSSAKSRCNVLEEDWDNLIILDACRYDMFGQRVDLEGHLQARVSLGSTSQEFLEGNFADETAHDTVYISANPYTTELPEDTFHDIQNLFISDWNSELETVHPEEVRKATIEAHSEYPQKRLIAHFMQPHYPFLGELGHDIDHRGFTEESVKGDADAKNVWELVECGELSRSKVWEAYCENLEYVIEYVHYLLEDLTGKTVITADHGNLVGDRTFPIPVRGYDHPDGIHVKQLVKVPWFIPPHSTRRDITADPPVEVDRNTEDIESQLEALGYR